MTPFNGTVERVIDGDTLWVRVRMRLRSSSPPESTEVGAAETRALAAAYPRGTDIVVQPIVTDQYGRPVVTIARGRVGTA